MDVETAYFLKKYYPHVIKWWVVVYNPEVFRVWPSKEEKEEALRIEAEEKERLALALPDDADESAYNETTGSYSGLYGQKPVDADTQAALDAIMNTSSNQSNVDSLLMEVDTSDTYSDSLKKNGDVILPPEHEDIVNEANEIYQRLLDEAAEDEARKQAEIETAMHDAMHDAGIAV